MNKSDLGIDALTRDGRMLPMVEHAGDSPLGQMTVLYDLSADISERSNLAAQRPETVERLDTGACGMELRARGADMAKQSLHTPRAARTDGAALLLSKTLVSLSDVTQGQGSEGLWGLLLRRLLILEAQRLGQEPVKRPVQ